MLSELITKLNETNYDTWSLIMKALLICKDLWDVIDGSEPHPTGKTNSKAVRAYEKKHPHVQEGGPSKIWQRLRKVHTAHRFASWFSMCWHLLMMMKFNRQTMHQWIVAVKHIAYHLQQAHSKRYLPQLQWTGTLQV